MRNLIQSLQKHNQQLKADAQRNRRKVKEIQCEVNKVGGINSACWVIIHALLSSADFFFKINFFQKKKKK